MLYLANATIRCSPYMGSSYDQDVVRLVEAGSSEEAHQILSAYYLQKSSDYGDNYSVVAFEATSTITKKDIL